MTARRGAGQRHTIDDVRFRDGFLACCCGATLSEPGALPAELRDTFAAHRAAHDLAPGNLAHPVSRRRQGDGE